MCFSKYILCCCCLVIQLCPTLYDPTGCSPPGPSVHGILQARTLEWVPFPSPGSSQPRDWTCVFYVSCFHRQILYHWATSEAQAHLTVLHNLHLNPHIGKANSKVIYRCSAAWSISAHNPRAVQGSTVLTLLHVHSWDLYLDMARQRQVLLWREKTAKNPEGWDKHLFLENVITDSAGQVESARWRSKSRMTRDAPRTVGHRQGPGGDLLTQKNTWAQRTDSTKATQQSAGDFWWMPTADPAFVCCAEKSCLLRNAKWCFEWIMQGEMAVWGGDMCSCYPGSAVERQAGTDSPGPWALGRSFQTHKGKEKKQQNSFQDNKP